MRTAARVLAADLVLPCPIRAITTGTAKTVVGASISTLTGIPELGSVHPACPGIAPVGAVAPVAVAVVVAVEADERSGTEERVMVSHKIFARRMLLAAVGCGAVLVGAVPASAQPPAPPNCTAADLSGIMSGVTASTSVYLYTHPPVNDFMTSLKDLPKEEKKAALAAFLDANPQVKAELQGIRQPTVDFRSRCGG